MRKSIMVAAAAVLSMTLGAATYAADMNNMMPEGVKIKEVKVGTQGVKVLSNAKGMTLYTFDNDKTAGKSVCNGGCATNWPPLMASASAKDMGMWTVVTRDDGGKQWAFKGKPLYTFAKDMSEADYNGNDVPKNMPVWHCALPG